MDGIDWEQLQTSKKIAQGLLELTLAIKGFTQATEDLKQEIKYMNDLKQYGEIKD